MYERSAIVLERYLEGILNLDSNYNLKKNCNNYKDLIAEIEEYQNVTAKEMEAIKEFDEIANEIGNLQHKQEVLYKKNQQLEDERADLFKDLGEDSKILESKLKKIEMSLEKNNKQSKKIREEFIQHLSEFSKKQKERNKCEKARRVSEAKHMEYLEKMNMEFEEIDIQDISNIKDFLDSEKDKIKQESLKLMTQNGKSERVPFNEDVLRKAINTRIDIAEKEAECYILVYDKMKKLLSETEEENIRLTTYKKVLRDTSVKLAFLKAENDYIISFLDYERMTAIGGPKVHKKMMIEACNNFELDMIQIKNLYELILKEIANKATQKAYKELYNKTYLKSIQDKEKNFEEEVNQVNISTGTVINSNYWRIDGIKNIYNVFQEIIAEKFGKDLTEYSITEENHEFVDTFDKEDDDDDSYEDIYENHKDYDEEEYEFDDPYEYEFDDEEDIQDESEDELDNLEDLDDDLDDEDSLEKIIEMSRKKAIEAANKPKRSTRNAKHTKENNKSLFNKILKKFPNT